MLADERLALFEAVGLGPVGGREALGVGDVRVDVGAEEELERRGVAQRAHVVHEGAAVGVLALEVERAVLAVDPARAGEDEGEHRAQEALRLRQRLRHELVG